MFKDGDTFIADMRYVIRKNKLVLQVKIAEISRYNDYEYGLTEGVFKSKWKDVPIHSEPKKQEDFK